MKAHKIPIVLSCLLSLSACGQDANKEAKKAPTSPMVHPVADSYQAPSQATLALHSHWRGKYYYSSYETAENGIGYGAEYHITIDEDSCLLEIVGYQVDKHQLCVLSGDAKGNVVRVAEQETGEQFGILRKQGGRYYLKGITYDDANAEVAIEFTELKR